jgi:hypothetical protein
VGRSIKTSISIGASRSRVWAVLIDFARYPEWNPFIRRITGEARAGAMLEVVIQPPGRKADTFRPRVIEVERERQFVWRGSLPIPGLFAGEHSFELRDEAGGTRFEQAESFSGLLVPFVGGILAATELGFESMNRALKAQAEGPQVR